MADVPFFGLGRVALAESGGRNACDSDFFVVARMKSACVRRSTSLSSSNLETTCNPQLAGTLDSAKSSPKSSLKSTNVAKTSPDSKELAFAHVKSSKSAPLMSYSLSPKNKGSPKSNSRTLISMSPKVAISSTDGIKKTESNKSGNSIQIEKSYEDAEAEKEESRYFPYSGSQEERDTISCIIPQQLYLTNHRGVGRADELEHLRISHIVCVNEQDNEFPDRFTYQNIDTLEDQEDHDASQHFASIISFTDHALAQGGAVCFHCAAGISRSSTMLIAYLMAARHMRLIDAFSLVFNARRVVWPNRAFMQQLINYESVLQRKGCLPAAQPSLAIEAWDAWTNSDEEQVRRWPFATSAALNILHIFSIFVRADLMTELAIAAARC